jgi:uncharacterized alkaline shock family protein YloU
MNALNRILVILVDLCVLALLALVALVTLGAIAPEALVSPELAAQLRAMLPVSTAARVATVAVAVALFVLGLILLYYELRPRQPRERRVTLRDDGTGRVTVAIDGLRAMASRAASALPGVRDARSDITDSGQTLRVAGRVLVDPGASVPDVAREVQERVRAVVEHTLGRPVSEVRIDAAVARPDQQRPARRVR